MRSTRAACRLLPLTLIVLAGCEGHGTYTSKFLEESARDMAKLRAATQYDLAVQQFHSGDLARALETIDGAIALEGEVGKAYLLRGRILLEKGDTDEALATLERGRVLDPADPGFAYYRGIAQERVGRLDDALASYQAASEIDPADAQYLLAAAEVLIELERLDEARRLLAEQVGDFESNAGVRQALGHIASLEGDDDLAVHLFTEAALLSPEDPVLREDLCHAQIAAGRFAEAELTLRRRADDEDYAQRPDLKHLHASCLIELDRPVEARSILYRLVRSDDGANDVEAWIKLIDVALMMRDDGLLRSAANRLMAAAPGRHEGYLALAMWQRGSGDLQGALRSVERAMDRAAGDPTPGHLHAIVARELELDTG
ncbi:MAG: tetratricopeptide repeat protein [Planctomycetota bacterium]|jgi:tetratricopeptide (TPR) repeat protein